MKKIKDPVEQPGWQAKHDPTSKQYEHPAFGMIGASRVEGDITLFGSDFVHHGFVRVKISRAVMNRDLYREWYHARDPFIEVDLSYSQWVRFLTEMNRGDGVPCTIDWVQGEGHMPGIPLRDREAVTKREFDDKARDMAAKVQIAMDAVGSELAGISVKKQQAVLSVLRSLEQDLRANMPFMAKSFGEHMEQVTDKAKIEVSTYVDQQIQRAGMNALAERGATLQLPSSQDEVYLEEGGEDGDA